MKFFKGFLVAGISLLIVACGGDGFNFNIISGTIVVPESPSATSAKIMANAASPNSSSRAVSGCPDVPEGYSPLSNADVSFLDAAGDAVGSSLVTDNCGKFSGVAPQKTVSVSVKSAGNRNIVSDITIFKAGGSGIVSTIPTTSTYQISAIQKIDNNKIGIVVTDDITNKAVIGIPASAFSVVLNGNTVSITDLSLSSLSDNSSVALVMDASGSMSANVFTDPSTGVSSNRNQLAALSAHTFLDQKGTNDEVSTVIFDTSVTFMDQSIMDGSSFLSLNIQDEFGNPATYSFVADGFTTDSSQMRFVIDAYNASSQLYNPSNPDPRHADTPSNLSIIDYNWGGGTAFYDAIAEGADRLNLRTNPRKFVVALTDGRENSSYITLADVIAKAKANNTPVYTIGFGDDSAIDKFELEQIATDTGASFAQVTDSNASLLTSVFQSILTNILFQYTGTLGEDLVSPYSLTLTLDLNGVIVSRGFDG